MPFKVSIFLLVHDGKLAFPVNLQVCFDVTLITVNKRSEKMLICGLSINQIPAVVTSGHLTGLNCRKGYILSKTA